MKLKAVEMQGFKSFPNKTKIEFGDGITAIIGPNGSGKSNISDSVRWVLGEMSVKSLRGKKMEDIIFNGAAGFSKSNSASVSLVLDTTEEYEAASKNREDSENTTGKAISLGNAKEVIITRKYYRSGDSEYYINKKQVRLKDIYELFYDTGIGREGYSVIGQGKISEVLSQKDEDRRSIFEEAAGISKYRYKKLEAERKLRDTEANLLRINDIAKEIKTRLGPLEKEAENAKAYLALSEEKKGLEITLWLERLDNLRKKIAQNEIDTKEAKTDCDELEEKLSAIEKELDDAINATYEISRDISERERLSAELKQSTLSLEGEKAVLENEVSHLLQKAEQNESQARLEEENLISLTSLLEEQSSKLDVVKAEHDKSRAEYDALMKRYSDEKNALALAIEEQNLLAEKKQSVAEELAKKKIELATKSAQSGALAERLSAAKQAVDEAEKSRAELETKLAETARKADEATEKATEQRRFNASLTDEITELYSKEESIRTEENELKLKLAAKEQKRDGLERLERLFEGYSDSVKTVLSAAQRFELKSRIYGAVSSLVSADGEFAAALECALGAASQYIIVGNEDDAKQCIAFLKQKRAGRATFLPLTTVNGRKADVSRIKNLKGYIGLASEIIKIDNKFHGVANDLLGRTVIADNMDNAVNIAKACNYRIKIVTKDAQVIHAGGRFTGGSELRRAGILTRALDIERLSGEIKELNEKLFDVQAKRNTLGRELQKKKTALDESRETLAELERFSASCESEYAVASAALAEAERQKSRLAQEYESLTAGGSGAAAVIAALEEEVNQLDAEEKQLIQALATAKAEADKRGEDDRTLLDKVNSFRLSLAETQNETQRLTEYVERLTREIEEVKIRKTQCETDAVFTREKIKESKEKSLKLDEQIAENAKEAEESSEKIKLLLQRQQEKQTQIANLRKEAKDLTADKENAFKRYTELSSKTENWNSEYAQLMSKLWDEYELTYSEADMLRLPAEKMDKATQRLSSIKGKIRSLGSINVNAVEEYKETKERYDFLSEQLEDLQKTGKSLNTAIQKLESNMKSMFIETFDKINKNFSQVFSELFGGGTAYVDLLEPNDPLGSGIDIIVKPPGKTIKNISLLSGGEQSFAAIALYLSLQRINPAPFCIFDEIDTALDEVNVNKLADFVRRNCDRTQYIFITHRRGTMERADRLYGIMMPNKGVSEYLKLDITKLREKERKEFALQ